MAESDEDHLGCCSVGLATHTRNYTAVPCGGEVGYRVPESSTACGPVALLVDYRVAFGRVACHVAVREKYIRAHIHVAIPELAELGAADLDVLQVCSVLVVALLAASNLVNGEVLDGLY